MAFEPVKNATRAAIRDGEVGAAVYAQRKGSHSLAIIISPLVVTKLGWTDAEARLQIMEGTGADLGMVLLSPAKDGATLTRADTNAVFRISVEKFKHLRFPEPQRAEICTFQAFGSALTILLPNWVVREEA